MLKKSLISLGSNIGDRAKYISSAIHLLKDNVCIEIINQSTLMDTSPIGVKDQDNYLNKILLIKTSLNPENLLIFLKDIEVTLGRKPRSHWAKREIDLDIITYEGVVIKSKFLNIPHSELLNRKFLLQGCKEVAPDYIVEGINISITDLYNSMEEDVFQQNVSLDTKGHEVENHLK